MILRPGAQFGRYEIVALLGAGGMGQVYRARDPSLNRHVAVKVIAEAYAQNPSFRDRFRREARTLAALSHPNIATIYSVEEADGILALTMELVEGHNLSDVVRPGGIATDRLLRYGIQIAEAIAAAHDRGITHRDLKPANVIVSPDGRVKVLDFGLARLAVTGGPLDAETSPPVSEITAEGHIVGTPSYMSPEQAEGKTLDSRSDIFTLGILLYELATGIRPFKGDSVLTILSSIVRDTPPAPMDLNPSLPKALSRVIRRCLEKDPENRYQSAKDLRSDLRDLLQEITSGDVSAPVPVAVRRRRSRWIIAAAIAAPIFAVAGWLARAWLAGPPAALVPERVVQLTTDPGIEASPSLSPDGRWIAFSRRNEGRVDVYLQAVGGEKAINLTADVEGGADQPAFSSDGEQIAFASPEAGGLFVMGRTGELVRRVTDTGFNPAWSRDGGSLVYSSDAAGDFPSAHPGGAEVSTVNLRTGEKRRLEATDGLQPVWSPDDKWIAYWGVDPATRQRDLWTIPAGGGTPTRVTNDAAVDGSPAWSPTADYLYFSSDRGGTTNLWRIRIDKKTGGARGEAEPVTAPTNVAVHPTISADGKRLAYASYSWATTVFTLGFDPARLEVLGRQRTVVAGGLHLWSGARVSADGSQIALVRWGHQHDLFVARADGSGLRRLTNDGQGVRCPDWSPDGKHIAFGRTVQTDGSLVVIEVETGKMTPAKGLPQGVVGCPSWSPDGSKIATTLGGHERGAYVLPWKQPGFGSGLERIPAPSEFAPRSWSADGQSLAGTIGTRLAVFSFPSRSHRLVTDHVAIAASYTAWLPGGRYVLFQGRSYTDLLIADISTQTVKRVFSVAPQLIRGASLTRDGTQLIVSAGSEEGDIWLANLPEAR